MERRWLQKNGTLIIAAVLVHWVLLWSLGLLFLLRGPNVGDTASNMGRYLLLLAALSALVVGYSLAFYLYFKRKQLNSALLRDHFPSSPGGRFLAYLAPGLLWAIAFGLHELAAPFQGAIVDGPLLLLFVSGIALFFLLTRVEPVNPDVKSEGLIDYDHIVPATQDQRTQTRRTTIAVLALLALIVMVTFWQSLFDPEKVTFGHDLLWLHYPFEHLVHDAINARRLPLWNPYIFSGSPALAHPQYLVFYPPLMLLRWLPLNLSISWSIAIHVWLAGAGMYLLSRYYFRFDGWVAATCALVYMLNSGLMLRVVAGHPWLIYALAWLPFAWFFQARALSTGRPWPMIGAMAALALIILSGHFTFPIYLIIFLALFALYCSFRAWVRSDSWLVAARVLVRFGLIAAGAFGLSAVQLLPTATMASQVSLAAGYDIETAYAVSMTLSDFSALLVPHVYLNSLKQKLIWEMVPYFGITFLMLSPVAMLAKSRRTLSRFLLISSVLAFGIAFGVSMGLFTLLYTFLPPFRLARIPPRSLAMLIPAVVVLGGLGLQALRDRQVTREVFIRLTGIYVALSLFVLAMTAGLFLAQAYVDSETFAVYGAKSLPLLVVSTLFITAALSDSRDRTNARRTTLFKLITFSLVLLNGLAIGLFIIPGSLVHVSQLLLLGTLVALNTILFTFLYRFGPTRLTQIFIFTVLLLDLSSASLPSIGATQPPELQSGVDELISLRRSQPFERLLSFGNPNHFMLRQIEHVNGYNSGILSGYETFLRAFADRPFPGSTAVLDDGAKIDARVLDFLGVGALIYDEIFDDSQYKPLASNDGMTLYKNPDPLPRAFVVHKVVPAASVDEALRLMMNDSFDFSQQVVIINSDRMESRTLSESLVSIEDYVPTSGNLTIKVQNPTSGILVMSEPYYSERRVWVDGEEVEALRVNVGFIGVELAEGEHLVELRYVPVSLYTGLVITAVTLLLCSGAIIAWYRRSGARPAILEDGLARYD